MRTADNKFGMESESVATEELSGAAAADKGKSSVVPFKQRFAKQPGGSSLNQSQDQGSKALNKGRPSDNSGRNKLEDVLVEPVNHVEIPELPEEHVKSLAEVLFADNIEEEE